MSALSRSIVSGTWYCRAENMYYWKLYICMVFGQRHQTERSCDDDRPISRSYALRRSVGGCILLLNHALWEFLDDLLYLPPFLLYVVLAYRPTCKNVHQSHRGSNE